MKSLPAILLTLILGLCQDIRSYHSLAQAEEPEANVKALPPAAPHQVDFVREIAPIFEQRCFACHGAEQQEGRLRLDARAIVRHGGISGPLFVAGESEKS